MANDKGPEFNFPHLDRDPNSYSLDAPPKPEDRLHAFDAADNIYKMIYTDTLTGFENRRGLNNFKNSLKPEDYPVLMLNFDLDNLKKINDNPNPETGGHLGGDKYILSFVKFTNEFLPNEKKFRLGGDEFTIPIKNSNPELIQKVSEDITSQLEIFNKREQNPNNLEFTFAYDIASSDTDFYEALKRSDIKQVEAKKLKKEPII